MDNAIAKQTQNPNLFILSWRANNWRKENWKNTRLTTLQRQLKPRQVICPQMSGQEKYSGQDMQRLFLPNHDRIGKNVACFKSGLYS